MRSASKSYSLILTVRGADASLPSCLRSIEKQTLGFEEHIEVIIAGYDATDDCKDAVKQWAEKFPDAVRVLSQEAPGLAEARNMALQRARGEWTTFLDAKDFLHDQYFSVVNEFINKNILTDYAFISCHQIFFNEVLNQFINAHPLRYKYKQESVTVDVSEHPEYIQSDVTSCFFKTSAIKEHRQEFDVRVRPSFGEGHFIYRLLVQSGLTTAAFLKDALYFHRIRKSPGNVIDPDWGAREKYRDQILFGYMDLAKTAAKTCGAVPKHIQCVLIAEVNAYLYRLIENQIPFALSQEDVTTLFNLLRMLFSHIENDTVLFTDLPTVAWRQRIAMLHALKGVSPAGLPFFVHEIAGDKKSLLLTRCAGKAETCAAQTAQGDEMRPLWEKRVVREFKGQSLCVEHYMRFPLLPELALSFLADGHEVPLFCGGQGFDRATGKEILAAHYLPESALPDHARKIREAAQAPAARQKYAGCWLFMDRADKADDNAEHLYRRLAGKSNLGRPLFYVLDKKSPDWSRLEDEGFHLLVHNSEAHLTACFHAEWVISSHLHPPLFDPLGTKAAFGLPEYQVTFLGHGITKDDVSKWFNPMPLDMVVSSTREEFDSLVRGNSKLTEREVVLAGMPRHDNLLAVKKRNADSRLILVCPTWRDNLCNPHTSLSPAGAEKKMFTASDYFTAWNNITGSERLAAIAKEHGYKFLFLPHPYVSRNVDLFNYTEQFHKMQYSQIASVQEFLASCALLVTDYSSMAMEVALLGTPVVYYHFNETPPFFSGHTYAQGSFSYENDGFGPVVRDSEALITRLQQYIMSGCAPEEVYKKRADAYFTLRDGKNCDRVYEAVIARSKPA